MSGTFPLPEAQLDRFLLCLSLGYPAREQELELLARKAPPAPPKPVVTAGELLAAQQELHGVTVSPAVQAYIADLAEASRTQEQIQLGLSTRGMLSLLDVSRAMAAIHGRDYVIPDDIKEIAPDCMSHRMVLRGGAWDSSAQECRQVVQELLAHVPVPKETQWN